MQSSKMRVHILVPATKQPWLYSELKDNVSAAWETLTKYLG